jgi:hypothetical protein
VGKTANSLLKDGAKIHLKNDRKIIRPKGLKSTQKSTEDRQRIDRRSTENRPKIDRESTENRPKIDRESTEDRQRIDRRSTENRPRIDRRSTKGWGPLVDEARPLDGGLRWKVSRGEIRGRCGG